MDIKTEKAKELLIGKKKIEKVCSTCKSGSSDDGDGTCENWKPGEEYDNGKYTWV